MDFCLVDISSIYTSGSFEKKKLHIRKYKTDFNPIDDNEISPMSETYTKAYLHHLFKTEEILGYRIATQHNLHFYIQLMKTMQDEIKAGDFESWARGFLERYEGEGI